MVCQEIKDFLAAHADARYAAFVTSLMPGARPVVGVRLPVLRALAKEITKGDWRTYLEEAVDDTFEEVMLQGYVTGAARMPFEEQMERMTAYVRKINDWALCDSPCSGFKFVRKHREEVWAFLQPYLYSGEVFSQRFAVVMLLAHFVTDDFIDRVLEACAAVRPNGYYASMAVAWAVSVCFAKYPEKTRPLLKDGWTTKRRTRPYRKSWIPSAWRSGINLGCVRSVVLRCGNLKREISKLKSEK